MGWGPADILTLVVGVLQSGIIEAIIRVIERVLTSASGAEKKEEAMRQLGMDMPPHGKAIVSAAIDAVVYEYNLTGVFTHRLSVPGGSVDSSGASGSSSGFAR
jgi:hypothetical protein